MEFRSYYGGTTVLCASSPGLQDATLTITSEGEPAFVPGTTVKPRPYVRFVDAKGRTAVGHRDAVFGANNPTSASSEAPGHPALDGNDGDDTTSWQPQDSDTNPWWRVDLERDITMSGASIDFPVADIYKYKVETSMDGAHWTMAVDRTQNNRKESVSTVKFPRGTTGHSLRVTFVGKPAGISEMQVTGRLSAQ
jgi:hypothetical protein